MKLYKLLYSLVVVLALMSSACSKSSVTNSTSSSSAGALTANTAIEAPSRPFGRHNLSSANSGVLTEFIRPEIRARLDEEPVGDTDGGYDPSASQPSSSGDSGQSDTSGEGQTEEPQQSTVADDDSQPTSARLGTAKFAWAKKSFGEAIKADITKSGVIVLYADENYYDMEGLVRFVEHGRDLIAERSGVGGERVQVVYGGYRAVPQVELWLVPQGGPMPEFKPSDRTRPSEPEN